MMKKYLRLSIIFLAMFTAVSTIEGNSILRRAQVLAKAPLSSFLRKQSAQPRFLSTRASKNLNPLEKKILDRVRTAIKQNDWQTVGQTQKFAEARYAGSPLLGAINEAVLSKKQNNSFDFAKKKFYLLRQVILTSGQRAQQVIENDAHFFWAVAVTTLGGIVALELMDDATEIVETVRESFNLAMFDEDCLSEKFTDALVSIHNIPHLHRGKFDDIPAHYNSTGTALIVRSDQHPDFYFVLTAAHCLNPWEEHFIQVQYAGYNAPIEIKPLILDRENDIAVLLLMLKDVQKIEKEAGRSLGFVPLSQLSGIKPEKEEVLISKGFPTLSKKFPDSLVNRQPHTAKALYKGPYRRAVADQSERLEERIYQDKYAENIFKRHLKLRLPGEPYNLDAESTLSYRDKYDLGGASGSPVVAIREKQPQVVGILRAQGATDLSFVVMGGVGYLPRYLQEAEQSAQQLKAEEKAREDEEKVWQERIAECKKQQELNWASITQWVGL